MVYLIIDLVIWFN